MSDFLRTDGRISRTLPNAYSELMLPVCGGHALWFPRKAELGGGALGDIGYIDGGGFEKTFNVYESLPGDLPLLPRPVSGMTLDEQSNMQSMQTSRSSQIELRISGSGIVVQPPLKVSPMTIEPRIALQEEKFAFLIPPQPIRRDHLNLDHCDELKLWLTANRRHFRDNSLIITTVVRSSGWLGGVATGRKVEASATLGANVPPIGRVELGASRVYETTQLADIKGPDDWTSSAGAGYVLIIHYVLARGRLGQLRDRFKFAAAASSSSASRPTCSPAAQSDDVRIQSTTTDQAPASGSTHDPETEARDNTASPSASSDSSDEGDSILLAAILDDFLATHPNVDVAVAGSDIISDFIQVHSISPSPAEVEAVMALRQVESKHDGRVVVESVAFVSQLRPLTKVPAREALSAVSSPGTEAEGPSQSSNALSVQRSRPWEPPSYAASLAASSDRGNGESSHDGEKYVDGGPASGAFLPLRTSDFTPTSGEGVGLVTPFSGRPDVFSRVRHIALDHLNPSDPRFKTSIRGSIEVPSGFDDLLKHVLVRSASHDAVFEAKLTHANTGAREAVAVKVLAKYNVTFVVREFAAWKALDHERLLKLYGHCTLPEHILLVSPWMRHGHLGQYLADKDDADRHELLVQVAEGLAYLHDVADIVHGNVKTGNILIDDEGNVKIVDFGLSTSVQNAAGDVTTSTTIREHYTVRFCAPELLEDEAWSIPSKTATKLKRRSKTRESDVYGFAMIMLQVFSGRIPWADIPDHEVISKVYRKERPTLDKADNDAVRARGMHRGHWLVCQWCWEHEPDERLPMRQVRDLLCLLHDEKALELSLASFPTDAELRVWDAVPSPSPTTSIGSVTPVRKKKPLRMGATAANWLRGALSLHQGTGYMPIVPNDGWVKDSHARLRAESGTKAEPSNPVLARPACLVTRELWQQVLEHIIKYEGQTKARR